MTLASQRYAQWLRLARRHAPSADEAADLLQEALLAALESKRQPLADATHDPWFHGVLRRLGAFRARGASRRQARERAWDDDQRGMGAAPAETHAVGLIDAQAHDEGSVGADDEDARAADAVEVHDAHWRSSAGMGWGSPLAAHGSAAVEAVGEALRTLPPSLRSVMTLALHGLDRDEIRQVLDLPDTALRQRLSALKRRMVGSPLASLRAPFQAWVAERNGEQGGLRRAALARGPARIDGFRMGVSDPDGHLLGIHVPRRSGQ